MSIHRGKLSSSEDGAVMLVGLFLALFLAGSVFAVLSVGDSILYRRTMQEGADAGSFAAGVVAAKGMNLHAFFNIAMAATAGVLLVVRSVEVLLEIILAILQGMMASIVLAPKAAPLIAVITPAEATVERIGDGVEQFVRVSHDALDVAHHAVQHGYPLLAEARAMDAMVLRQSFHPPIVAGFVLPVAGPALPPGTYGLPVETSSVDLLCDRAANAMGGRIANVQARVPRWLMRFLGGTIERALRLGKRRTCADDVVESPRGVLAMRRDDSLVWLGHEEFQYRAFALGQSLRSGKWMTGERGLQLATLGSSAEDKSSSKLLQAGRLSFSQSEFYHQSRSAKSEWLWTPRWRARLRRFAAATGTDALGWARFCSGVGGLSGGGRQFVSLCEVIGDLSEPLVSAH